MAEPVQWLDDGTPYNPRFRDRYRSELAAGLAQAEGVFMRGCGLPDAWRGQRSFTILETGFGLGLNFLVAWAAWRADPARPERLHFVSVEAFPAGIDDMVRSAQAHPHLLPLAEELRGQYWGLTPGVHRLSFDEGRVLLTLCVGDARAMLLEQSFEADAVFLDGFSPSTNTDIWSVHTLKAVARCCRRGTRVATWTIARAVRDGLAQCGFSVRKVPGVPPKRDRLEAVYEPAWPVRRRPGPLDMDGPAPAPACCIVIGGGMAGACVARSLADRGWQVEVLDAAALPAAGASGLPVGLFAPHPSVDDSVLSRLSRAGVRATLLRAGSLLRAGIDWQASGVLERRLDDDRGSVREPEQAGLAFSRRATAQQLQEAALPAEEEAYWHETAGWIKPGRLVSALLAHPAIRWQGSTHVARLERVGSNWQALAADGQEISTAPLVVVAAGIDTEAIVGTLPGLTPIRGQVSWAPCAPGLPCPPWPVNGRGHFIGNVPQDEEGTIWLAGSTFDRDHRDVVTSDADQQHNLARLHELLPTTAKVIARDTPAADIRAWAGVRCASHDRLPVVGPIDAASRPGLWLCTAMGSRGLTFAPLAADLLAARLHHEPLPLTARLAAALDPARLFARQQRLERQDVGHAGDAD